MRDPSITIAPETFNHSCMSCTARNYEAYTKPVDVDQLFTLQIGNQAIALCAQCLQVLAQVIHPHRTGV